MKKISSAGWTVGNADLTLIAEVPRVAPHADAMCNHLASDLNVAANAVNIKATTSEGLGYTGRKEGIAAMAVVLLERV